MHDARTHLRLTLFVLFFISLVMLPVLSNAALIEVKNTEEKKYTTSYAAVFYERDEDLYRFAGNIGTGLSFLIHNPKKNLHLTAKRVDTLVARVMTILDMPMPGLRFAIRVFHNQDDLDLAYIARTRLMPAPQAFYDHETTTIAIAADSVNENVLAHEIAHAIICAWFRTPPPARMQEILAQYVDRHLGE